MDSFQGNNSGSAWRIFCVDCLRVRTHSDHYCIDKEVRCGQITLGEPNYCLQSCLNFALQFCLILSPDVFRCFM